MQSRVLSIGESYVLAYETKRSIKKNEALFLLHGFPAHLGTKNSDIAVEFVKKFDVSAYLIHYKGLGNAPGSFSFEDSITESISVANQLIKDKHLEKLHVLGHSWGGFVAINIATTIKETGKVVLLAPFSQTLSDKELQIIITEAKALNAFKFKSNNDNEIFEDFRRATRLFSPLEKINNFSNLLPNFTIFRATKDLEILPSSIDILVSSINPKPHLIDVNENHAFNLDRPTFISNVLKCFLTSYV